MSILSMTKTLMKSILRGPYTVQYPIKRKEVYSRTRGHIGITISDCIYCKMCERRCPTGAIKVEKERAAWSIERLQCIQCGYCTEVCPKKCLTMENQYTAPSFSNVRDEYINARVSDNTENH
jgi:ech hydrogenase subunit F